MPLPVLDTGDAFHVAFKWTDGTQYAINTMSFHVDAGGTAADLATALDSANTAALTPDCADSARVVEYDITPYDGVSAATPIATGADKWLGHTGGQWVPQVSEVVTFKTGIADRRARGRMYLPFIVESAITDGFITSGSEVTMAAAWNTFLSAVADDGFTPIIASTITSRTHTVHNVDHSVTRGIPIGPALTPTSWPITVAQVKTKLGTQRRRQSRL